MDTTELKGPLTIFQHTKFDKSEFKKLVKTINSAGGDHKLEDSVLDSVFEMWWGQLEDKVRKILTEHQHHTHGSNRSERDILEEVLELSRLNARRRIHPRELPQDLVRDLMEAIHEIAIIAASGQNDMLPLVLRQLDKPLHYLSRHAGTPEADERLTMLRHEIEMLEHRLQHSSHAEKDRKSDTGT